MIALRHTFERIILLIERVLDCRYSAPVLYTHFYRIRFSSSHLYRDLILSLPTFLYMNIKEKKVNEQESSIKTRRYGINSAKDSLIEA